METMVYKTDTEPELRQAVKAAGELLTGQDILNAFYLGDEQVGELAGRGPVAKSIRYLLRQCDMSCVEDEDEEAEKDKEKSKDKKDSDKENN